MKVAIKSKKLAKRSKKKNFLLLTSYFPLPKGQSLIEALGALAIIAIIVSAIAIAVTTALNNAKINQDQTLATKYAQQGIEIVRQIRNQNYAQFRTYNGTYCLGKGKATLGTQQANCTTSNVDQFIRSVQIQQTPGCSANVARITVNVAYASGKCQQGTYCHVQTFASCLSTVNPVQAP